jgi:hypothetical protein
MAPPPTATVKVEEIPRGPPLPPQLVHTVIRRGEEFETLEEASVEIKILRVDLAPMMGYIEVRVKK